MKKKLLLSGILLLLAAFFLTSCAAGPNPIADTPNAEGEIAGFWMGLWHGLICPITFIISLFTDSVNFYEVYNTGGWYDFGFLLGASCSLGGSGAGGCKMSRKKG